MFRKTYHFGLVCLTLFLFSFKARQEPVDLVNPFVDSANSRWFFFSSATRPFGMVNLSPDMVLNGAWNSGYRYDEPYIRAFSHIHAWQLSGIPVMPSTGEFKGHQGPEAYKSRYSHDKEIAKPGYHKVVLDDYQIQAELTSTTRVGFHRYTFPASAQSHILFDLTTVLGPSEQEGGSIRMISDKEISGYAIMAATSRRPKPVKVYFTAMFDKPFDSFNTWQHGSLKGVSKSIQGEKIGAYLSFTTKKDEVRKMKVAISYVSEEQSKLNLDTELNHWDFDRVVADARAEWNEKLGRIQIEGGTDTQQKRFYTDLWHALQGRRIISDANGKYTDNTGDTPKTKQIPLDKAGKPLFTHHNSDSFWGAQWSLNTLWHLVYPEVTESFVQSMLMMYDDGGLIPRGPSGGNYTYVMTGASSTPFITSAYLKGIRGFDIEKAYKGLVKNHLPGGMMSKAGYEHTTFKGGGIESYIEKGYIPHPLSKKRYGGHQDGSAQTLEYAYQDYALAQLAKKLGKTEDFQSFSKRALNYQNIYNKDIGWMWTRDSLGQWTQPVDILRYMNGWVEGNAAQYTWFVPHDLKGLIGLMGGKEAFNNKLNQSFEYAQKHDFVSGKNHAGETLEHNRKVYINYGNQPCMQTAYLFNYSGAPWLTQYWTQQVIEKVYSDLSPQYGYSGDEDQGLMGSLAVLLKIGIFSTNGGTSEQPFYEVTTPLFDKVTIKLNPKYYSGKTFTIEKNLKGAKGAIYIQNASLNGSNLNQPWILHETLTKGGNMKLSVGESPNKTWGSAPEQAPPSMTP
ncbi:GH92 family glycosyl hydrolase [Dyadobacter tibetensis]|uniref:GH92 family glycosyl hydrolase n=1 Tax=Dyadobacter tibetensis TaxID=1211851 RepID=UPI000470D5C9|nr:GH92 family glycosyl hydrolase [Dyadobacter tibetensis]